MARRGPARLSLTNDGAERMSMGVSAVKSRRELPKELLNSTSNSSPEAVTRGHSDRRELSSLQEQDDVAAAKQDKFMVGLIGAAILVTQVVLAIAVVSSLVKKENQEMLDALTAAGVTKP
mmetsp:Transcript_147174/g.256899  ORF Transcript_147174/g.256899 Transcript_147174/m.256899 type:complete len:120 (+) Transcript_147174:136-495(+)